jgi:hypothetical protein
MRCSTSPGSAKDSYLDTNSTRHNYINLKGLRNDQDVREQDCCINVIPSNRLHRALGNILDDGGGRVC